MGERRFDFGLTSTRATYPTTFRQLGVAPLSHLFMGGQVGHAACPPTPQVIL